MRLLQCDENGNYSLVDTTSSADIPPYAILSHTWGSDEVVFSDLAKIPSEWQQKTGFPKIDFCAKQTRRDGLHYFWVDTCCIDRTSSQELQTAINSMFRWYRDADRCYVYLPDVSGPAPHDNALRQSRWFTRGWTLQELIAPKVVEFFSKEGTLIGSKQSLEPFICDITGIPSAALRGAPLSDFPVSERQAWIRGRQTKYEEDMAYSLLGIFDVHMPLIYGEGREKAQKRLQEEVQKAIKGTQITDFSIPFSLSEAPQIEYFVARETEIIEMRRTLISDGSRRVVVLHGLGGIGKTQLAVSYMQRYRDEYSAIFWFNISDQASIEQSFIRVARQILQQHPNTNHLSTIDLHGDQEEVINTVKAWLSLPDNTRWLLVFDNYDNAQLPNQTNDGAVDINHFLPASWQGSIIVTTRLSQVDIGHRISIKKLENIQDSIEILSSTSGREGLSNSSQAKILAEKLDGLPLALATAGTYLRRVPSVSFEDYLRLYETSWTRLHTGIRNLGSYKDRTLCSTWQISYEQVRDQDPLAAQLLQWWAFFDNKDVWFELLQPIGEYSASPFHGLADELNFNNAMGTLQDYGFVEPHTFSDNLIESRGYNIHSCLHSWTLNVLNERGNGPLLDDALLCLVSRIHTNRYSRQHLLNRRLLPHALVCSTLGQEGGRELYWAFNEMAFLLTDQGKFEEAEKIYLRAIAGKTKAFGSNHISTLETVNALGYLYTEQREFKKAEETFLHALARYKKAKLLDYPSRLITVNNLGNLYTYQGKTKDAEKLYLHALAIHKKGRLPGYEAAIDTTYNLGNLYGNQGRLEEAEKMYLYALTGQEKLVGPDHTSTLDIVNNLGLLYTDQGKFEEAEKMYLRTLIGKEKNLGPNHASTLSTIYSLGICYKLQGKVKRAEEIYLDAMTRYKKAIPAASFDTHHLVINTRKTLGDLSKHQGRLEDARGYYESAYSGLEQSDGASPKDIRSLHQIMVDLNTTSSTPSSSTHTAVPTQASKSRRRDALKKVLGIRSLKREGHSRVA